MLKKQKLVWPAATTAALVLATAALTQERISEVGACHACNHDLTCMEPPIGYAYCISRVIEGVRYCGQGGPSCVRT